MARWCWTSRRRASCRRSSRCTSGSTGPMVRLADVDSSDLESAVRLGCHAMGAAFAVSGDGPLFEAPLAPEPVLAFHPWFSDAHIPGRHLVALLNAERTFAVAIDESLVERHQEALWRAFSGP